MPDVQMPDGQVVRFPDEMPKEDIKAFIYTNFGDKLKQKNLEQGNELTRGFARGMDTSGALVTEGVPALAKSVANKTAEALGVDLNLDPHKNLKEYREKVQKAYIEHPTKYESYKSIDSLKDIPGFAAAAIGENLPNIAATFTGGGIGAAVAKKAIREAAKKAGKELTEREVSEAMIKGASMGTVVPEASMNVPESYFNLLQEGKDDPLTAVAVGSLKTGLSILPEMKVFERVLGPYAGDAVGNALVNKLKFAGKTAAFEGATEGAQEFMDQLAEHIVVDPNKDLFTPENVDALIDNTLKGFAGGAFFGGVGSLAEGQGAPKKQRDKLKEEPSILDILKPKEKADLDAQFAEETLGPVPTKEDLQFVSDGAVTAPMYVPPEAIKMADEYGLDKDTLQFVDQKDVPVLESLPQLMEKAKSEYDLHDLYKVEIPDAVAPELITRRKGIAEGKRTDAAFIPGDGEIVLTDPTSAQDATQESYQMSPLSNPFKKVKVTDALQREQVVRPKPLMNMSPNELLQVKDRATPINKNRLNFKVDNPGKDWLANKQKYAEEDIKKYGKETSSRGKGLNGSVTGYYKQPLLIPVETLQKLPGAMGEEKFRTDKESEKYKGISKAVEKEDGDKFFKENPILIGVNHKGEAYIIEGNHRTAVANDLGYRYIPAEVQYWNGGEESNGILNPKEVDKIALLPNTEDLAHLSRYDGPVSGDIESVYLSPDIQFNNLLATELGIKAKEDHKDMVQGMQRILKALVGEGFEVKPFEYIIDSKNDSLVHGYQYLNTIGLALNNNTLNNVSDTFFHEVWHMLESMGAVQDADQHTHHMVSYLNKVDPNNNHGLIEELLKTHTGREEIRAMAFGTWAKGLDDDRKTIDSYLPMSDDIKGPFRKWFRQANNFIRKVRNMLKGMGYNSYEDIFVSAIGGERNVGQYLANLQHAHRTARLARMAEEYQEQHQQSVDAEQLKIFEKARTDQNEQFDKKGSIRTYGRFFSSYQHSASKEPFIAQVYDSFRRRIKNFNNNLGRYQEIMGDFVQAPKATRYRIHQLMDYCRNTDQKARLDQDGFLTFERDGQIVKLKDKDISRQYIQLQNAYGQVLKDWESHIKLMAQKQFSDFIKDPNFDVKELISVMRSLEPEKYGPTIEKMQNTVDALNDISKMANIDYVPHQRYGSWGITVRDKEGKQVDLFTVEDGGFMDKHNKTYSKYQLEQTLKKIKERYSDTTKYDVIGDKGTIKDFSSINSLQPFKMTHNTMTKNIDPRFVNLELLSSLLHSKNINPKDFEQMREQIYEDIMTRGFKTRFAKSDDVGIGYSDDWDRAMHSSFSGAAHFFASVPQAVELAALKDEAMKLKDDKLREKMIGRDGNGGYIGYSNSIQDDMQALRTFNFLWAMGGNISTAILQLYTLPTMTLGNLSQYNPNVLQNAKTIAKWTKIAMHFVPSLKDTYGSNQGMAFIDFSDKSIIQKLVNNKTITEEQAKFLIKESSRLRGSGMADDFSGFSPYETRYEGGEIKQKFDRAKFYLGVPTSMMEQITRFSTSMAAFETMTRSEAQTRAKRMLEKDHRFQAQVAHQPGYSFAENAASFIVDESHAVFGKYGRPEFFRGIGGAVFLPFTTYQHQMLEFMARMYGRGPEGKKALALTLMSMFLFAGMMGLPGAELIKKALEMANAQVTGVEEDLDLLIREKLYAATGSEKAGKFITQGFGRAFAGVDAAKRLGLGIPGTDIILMLLGDTSKKPQDTFGVAGSIIPSVFNAWNSYNNDSNIASVIGALMPSAAGNALKAFDMTQNGVKTSGTNPTQLLTQDEVGAGTVALKALGFSSDQVASRREELYYGKILPQRKYKIATDRFRQRAKNHKAAALKAEKRGDYKKARKEQQAYRDVMKEYIAFGKEHKIPIDLQAFNKSVQLGARQRVTAELNPKELTKVARRDLPHVQKVLGTERE